MKILLLEDDPVLSTELIKFLQHENYSVSNVSDGMSFLTEIQKQKFDIYLLDINVPKMNGLEVCRKIREKDRQTIIIIISAYGELSDKRKAFENLADDYLVKPFQFEELQMRISALQRRKATDHNKAEHRIAIADLEILKNEQKVFRGGKEINLTVKEYFLLLLLAEAPGRIFSKQQISEKVWDIHFSTNTNTIEVYINFLRKKIDRDFATKLIHTRPGFGYYLKVEE